MFNKEEALIDHMKKNHNKSFQKSKVRTCESCGKYFLRRYLLINHIKKKHPKAVIKCHFCQEEFIFQSGNKIFFCLLTIKDLEFHLNMSHSEFINIGK